MSKNNADDCSPSEKASDYKHLDRYIDAEHGLLSLGRDRIRYPDGSVRDRAWVDISKNGAYTIAITDDGTIPLMHSYRPKQEAEVWEFPGGGVDDGENFAQAGARELREEAGYKAGHAETLRTWRANGHIRARNGVVVARDLEYVGTNQGDFEYMETINVTPEKLSTMVQDNNRGAWFYLPYYIALDEGVFENI